MFANALAQHIDCMKSLTDLAPQITQAGNAMIQALTKGRKIMICGNGGSASDAQHFAAELIGRFEAERSAWPAIALTTDTSILTALANDYDYEQVFSRQVEGLGQAGDVLIGISTSGGSANVIKAVDDARGKNILTIGLLGRDGGRLKDRVDLAVSVQHPVTARIQEAHIFILHHWAGMIEQQIA